MRQMPPDIFSFVRSFRDSYRTDYITIAEGYEYSQYETINKIELYDNSRYVNGQTDGLGRLKPFYNIGNRLLITSDTAEDIDRKDITITSDDKDAWVKSFIFTKENQKWMHKSGFGQTLNEMTHTRGKYGGVLVKKTETDDELKISVVDWRNTFTDQVDIAGGNKIERYFYTPSELMRAATKGGWDMENVRALLESATTDQDTTTEHHRPSATPYIEVYFATGVFPKHYFKEDEDEFEFEDRMYVLGGVDNYQDVEGGGIEEDGIVLFTEELTESIYKYLPYESVPGRGLGRGRIETAFEAQQWTNDIVLKQKNMLDLPSSLFITDDKKIGSNVLTDKRVGDILKLQTGKQFNVLNTTPAAFQHLPGLIEQWNTQVERSSSVYASNTGENVGDIPYRLGALLNQEANSVFKDHQDEMGFFIQEIYRDWVIPFLRTQLQKEHTLVADFSPEELKKIDQSFTDYEAGHRFIDQVLSRKSLGAVEGMLPQMEQEARQWVQSTKNKRFLHVPEGYFDNVEFDLEVNVTNEDRAKAVYLESLNSILTTVSNSFDPQTGTYRILQDETLRMIFEQIMEVAGFSPVNLPAPQPTPAPAVPAPQGMAPGAPAMPAMPAMQLPQTASSIAVNS